MIIVATLTPRTLRARTRVASLRQQNPEWDGKSWTLLMARNTVQFKDEAGPWLFVSPDLRVSDERADRWVHLHRDPNFDVTLPFVLLSSSDLIFLTDLTGGTAP